MMRRRLHDTRRIAAACALGMSTLLLGACGQNGGSQEQPPTPDAASQTAAPPETTQTTERLAQPEGGSAQKIEAVGLMFTLPETWAVRTPEGGFRIIEARGRHQDTPPTLEEATFVATHFGPTGAGSHEANLLRWARQVVGEEGEALEPVVGQVESDEAEIVSLTFESSGTFMSGMPGQPATPKPGSTMLAAIVEGGPEGPVYLKLTGPARTIDDLRPAWARLLRTIAPVPDASAPGEPTEY